MTHTHRHAGGVLPAGVLVADEKLPDGLPFTAHALTITLPGLGPGPALLLIPQFTATMTDDEGDTYSPLPYMLDAEGFEHMGEGLPLPIGTRGAPAQTQGWALRRRRNQVEVSRRHKSLWRGPLASAQAQDTGGELWRRALGQQGRAVVLVPETDPGEKLPELVAMSLTGSWAVLPARGF
ncbi:hypothetical protein [Streptacidiphilus sp. EB103A]|uniref:hypothetical protein n=1 Tax=Streptacidiphilus sp. EB103A TaxID=3156275 RepID=UPI003514BC9A